LLADEVLQQGVRGITDLMVMPGLINLDFADVRSVMHEMGKAMMGTGEAEGDGRALEAAERAIANPLLDGVSMKGAKGVIISITGGEDMRLMEVDEAANHIRELVDPDANIIWGSAFNDNLNGKIRVSVVATGIDQDTSSSAQPARSFTFDQVSRPSPVFTPEQMVDAEPVVEASIEVEEPTGYVSAEENHAVEEDDALVLGEAEADGGNADDDDLLELGEAHVDEDATGTGAALAGVPEGSGLIPRSYEDTSDMPSEPSSPAPRVSTSGGTLFERMTSLSRGLSRGDEEEEDDNASPGLNIPRFLDRQSNN
jgi:cell division protein FtsZ